MNQTTKYILLIVADLVMIFTINGIINQSSGTGFWCPFCSEHNLMKGLRHEN